MPLTPTPSRVLSHSVISDGAPCEAKCMVPERRPSFMTLGPATLIQLAFTSMPADLACFSIRPACSSSMSGRKLTPYCCATVISPSSARIGEVAASSAPKHRNHFLIASSPWRAVTARAGVQRIKPQTAGSTQARAVGCRIAGSLRSRDRRRRNALDHDVDQGRFPARERALDGARQVGGTVHQLAMAAERVRDLVVARRQELAPVHAVLAVVPALDLALRVPTRVVAHHADERQCTPHRRFEF